MRGAGLKLARIISPLADDPTVGRELHRRLLLWFPASLRRAIDAGTLTRFLPRLRAEPGREIIGWLRLINNSFTTKGRLLGHYQPCLACGESGMGRLSHIVLCKQFWQPVYRAAGTEQRRVLVSEFLCDANAARRAGIAARAHASIRSPGLLQWQEAVTAAAR